MRFRKLFISTIIWIKNNLFPFTLWIIFICKINRWNIFFIVTILIKIPYLLILIYLINLIIFKIIIFVIIIPLLNPIFINIKKILFILSTNNIIWFVLIIYINRIYWILIITNYYLFNIIIFKLINKFKINYINQRNLINKNFNYSLIIIIINIINLPPFTIFLFKWILIKIIFVNKLITLIFLINNLLSFFLYIKILIKYLNKNRCQFKWIKSINLKNKNILLNLLIFIFYLIWI